MVSLRTKNNLLAGALFAFVSAVFGRTIYAMRSEFSEKEMDEMDKKIQEIRSTKK